MGTNFRRQILTSKVCPRAERVNTGQASVVCQYEFTSSVFYDYDIFTVITMAAFISIVINHRKNTLIFTHKNQLNLNQLLIMFILSVALWGDQNVRLCRYMYMWVTHGKYNTCK